MGSRKKNCQGGGGKTKNTPQNIRKKETHHMEKMASTWREMTAPT